MAKRTATEILRSVANTPLGFTPGNSVSSPTGKARAAVAGQSLLAASEQPGPPVDRPQRSGGKGAGLNRGAVELPARSFSAAGELARDHISRAEIERLEHRVVQAMNLDAFLGAVTQYTAAQETKPASLTLPELQRTMATIEAIARQQPFQLSHFMAKDYPNLVKCEGKYHMGRDRWREFNEAFYAGESTAIKWLLAQKVLDLDAAAKP